MTDGYRHIIRGKLPHIACTLLIIRTEAERTEEAIVMSPEDLVRFKALPRRNHLSSEVTQWFIDHPLSLCKDWLDTMERK